MVFLQVHDIFHPFIQTSDDEITFITVNESKTGFCHLYKITSVIQRGRYHWAKGYTHSEGNGQWRVQAGHTQSNSESCFTCLVQLCHESFAPLSSDDFKCPVKEEVTVTSGEWEVLANHGAKVKTPECRLLTFTAVTQIYSFYAKMMCYGTVIYYSCDSL